MIIISNLKVSKLTSWNSDSILWRLWQHCDVCAECDGYVTFVTFVTIMCRLSILSDSILWILWRLFDDCSDYVPFVDLIWFDIVNFVTFIWRLFRLCAVCRSYLIRYFDVTPNTWESSDCGVSQRDVNWG